MKHKILFSGLSFILAGVTSLFLENTFYQYVDESGVLHESLFLPLGVLAVMIGAILLTIFALKCAWQWFRLRKGDKN